jgi:hypothetical protein
LKPWRSDDGKRGGLAAVAYGQKKTWQTRNVIRVIVRDQQRIKMAYLASCRPQGYLRAFAAVDQQRFSLAFKPAAGQPPARQWDHAAGARQANVNHPVQLAFFISKIFSTILCLRYSKILQCMQISFISLFAQAVVSW